MSKKQKFGIVIKTEDNTSTTGKYFAYIHDIEDTFWECFSYIRGGEKFEVETIAPRIVLFSSPDASEYTDNLLVLQDADGAELTRVSGDAIILSDGDEDFEGFDLLRAQDILMSLSVNGKPAVPELVSDFWMEKRES